jgi:hypothetical protein
MLSQYLSAVMLLFLACSNAPEQKPLPVAVQAPVAMINTPANATQAPPEPAVAIKVAPKKQSVPKKTILPTIAAPTVAPPVIEPTPVASKLDVPTLSHLGLDSLLQKHVSNTGNVNYKDLKADKAALDAYCQLLSDNPVQETWTREEKMAFWINAYNAFTLKLIVDNYPTKSILNFDGGKTWDVRRIRIGDKKYSLNNIENDILRPVFKDPRIHFAINCAAKSCPPLWNQAYTADNLEASLESRTRAFVNNTDYNTLSSARAQVSKIFEWYGADFGNLREFLNKYADKPLNDNAVVRFNTYDWDLNNGLR